MLAQEEQNDPLPCALLFVDQLFLKIRDSFSHKKSKGRLEAPVRRRIVLEAGKRDVEIIVNQGDESERRTIQRQITFQHPDPYAIASAPDSQSPSRSQVCHLILCASTHHHHLPRVPGLAPLLPQRGSQGQPSKSGIFNSFVFITFDISQELWDIRFPRKESSQLWRL